MRASSKVPKALVYQIIGFAVISLFVLLAYYPSLLHCARADQVTYLAEVAQKQSWWDLAINSYNLNRHRVFCPGDELLFRPIVYFLLGTERFIFHYNYMGWQAVGIALHLGVVWFLLRLLLTIRVSLAAVVFVGLFALMYINMEMVVWQHINGYMIFMIALLIALRRWWLLIIGDENTLSHVIILALSVLVGCFTYEVMNVLGLILVGSLLITVKSVRRFWWLMLLPIALYLLASIADAFFAKIVAHEASRMVQESANIVESLQRWWWTVWFWLFTTIFAVQLPIVFIARNVIDPNSQGTMFNLQWHQPSTWFAFFLLVVLVVTVSRNRWDFWRRNLLPLAVLGLMMAIYAAIIVLGRANSRGIWDILRVDLYYQYLFCLISVVFVFVAIDWQRPLSKLMSGFAMLVLGGFIVTNAVHLHWANTQQLVGNEQILSLTHTLEELVKEKRQESDFSFYVADNYPGNYIYPEIRNRYEPNHRYSYAEALYPQYFKRHRAKYSFLTKR